MDAEVDIITFCAADFIGNKSYRRFEYTIDANKKIEGKNLLRRVGLPTLCAIFYISKSVFRAK